MLGDGWIGACCTTGQFVMQQGLIEGNICDWDGNVIDECGVCDGDNSSCADCAGVPNGDAVEDCAGVCNGGAVEDCTGVCGGLVEIDACGICDGENVYADGSCDQNLRFGVRS